MHKLEFFRRGRLQRNLSRTHRPCRTCASERVVCPHCTNVICEVCGHECTSAVRPATTSAPVAKSPSPSRSRHRSTARPASSNRPSTQQSPGWVTSSVRGILEQLGVVGTDHHPDNPTIFRAIFLKHGKTVADYDKVLWSSEDFRRLATDEQLGVGAVADLTHCYLPFKLRE